MTTIQDIRKQYPQYSDMTDTDLASALHKKYYSDMPFDEFSKKISLNAEPTSYDKGRGEQSYVKKGLANVIQGPTFGFGDEIIGGVVGAAKTALNDKPFSQNYAETRDYVRGVQDQYKQDYPITSIATQLAASAPAIAFNPLGRGVAAGAGAISPRLGQMVSPAAGSLMGAGERMARAGASGFGYGAVSGAGESTADSFLGITEDAAKSGALSAGLGIGTQGVTSAIGAAGRQILPRISDTVAGDYAKQKVAEAIARDATGEVFESGSSNAANRAAARLRTLGPEARVVDASGQNTRQLLDTTATLPGKTKNLVERAIKDRQISRADRMTDAASFMNGGNRYTATLESLNEVQQRAASPIYGQLETATISRTDVLDNLMSRPVFKQAIEQANLNRLNRGLPAILDDAGNVKGGLGFRFWDELKKGLDDVIGGIKRGGGDTNQAKNTLAGALDTKTTLVNEINRQTGGKYRAALDAWSGPAALKDAMEEGLSAFNKKPAELRQMMTELTESERNAFRTGLFESMRDKLGTRAGQNSILNLDVDRTTREKLMSVFPSERAYRQFLTRVLSESRMKGLESVGRGSQTAPRLAGMVDMDISPLLSTQQAVTGAVTASPTSFLAGVNGLLGRVQTPEPVRDQIGQLLLSRNPNDVRALGGLLDQINAQRARNSSLIGGFSGQPAGLLNQNLNQ